MARIITKPGKFETDTKRFYSGVVIEDICPVCGELCTFDGRNDYLSYPNLNDIYKLNMYCYDENKDEEHEWTIKINLEFNVSLVEVKND